MKRFERFIAKIEQHCRTRVYWVRALERQRRDVIHFHALVGGVGDVNPFLVLAWWKQSGGGFAQIHPFDRRRTRRAIGYLTKGLRKGAELDVGGLFPNRPE